MKNYFITLTGGICFLLMSLLCEAQQTGTFTIKATNFEVNTGVAVVQLFREQDDIPKKPFVKSTGSITKNESMITFSDLPYGDYAVIVFHDVNGNGILDHKFGFPNEPMGFSNDWKLSLFSGMPTFGKLKIEFSAEKKLRIIKLK